MILIVLAGIAYLIVATIACARFGMRPQPAPNLRRGVTILKPVHGLEPQLEENLRSFCRQEHSLVQIIFGVQRAEDPAIPIIESIIASEPKADCRLVIDETPRPGNPKMANVASMMPFAKHDVIAISDADMRVDGHYAGIIAAAFDDDRVGAATCLYAGVPAERNPASELAAMHINEVFAPSVLVATLFSPPRFCFGSTMAVRGSVLDDIGGIEALASHLADDYTLGRLVNDAGYRVELSPYVVRNIVHEKSTRTLFDHELRWARTIRMVQPIGYFFSFITYPTLFALVYAIARFSSAAAAIALSAILLRILMGIAADVALNSLETSKSLLRWPYVRFWEHEFIELAVWFCGLFGKRVRWQEQTLVTTESDLL